MEGEHLPAAAGVAYGSTAPAPPAPADPSAPGWKFWRRRRYVVAAMAFLGFFNVYALRVNLSVAIVAMTTAGTATLANGTTVQIPAEFDWDSTTQGLILSSFFYGYIVTQVPGGWLAARVGGSRVYGAGLAATAVLTLLTPPIARAGTAWLVAVRIVEGLFESKHQPPLVEGAVMRDYQLEGLDWLVALDNCGASGILADEMGLGKTLQVISLISFLLEEGNGNGDHFLVIAPLSAVQNWIDEFKKFAPKVPVILFYGPQEKRLHLEKEIFIRSKVNDKIKSFPVVITTFDTLLRDSCLQRINWRYLVIDEGQRIKNPEGILIKELRKYTFSNGCILTGTPVQNNMTELWSLLDFLHPKKIPDLDVFLNWFDDSFLDEANDNVAVAEEDSEVFSTLHKILKPFLLRRIKADAGLNLPPKKEIIVYATFTKWQERIYSAIVDKTLDLLQGRKKGFDDPEALCRAIKRQKLTSREEYKNETEPERPRRRRAAPAQPGYYYWLEKGVSMDSIQKTFQRDDCNDELVVDKLLEGLAEPDEEFITDIKKRHPMQALRLICSHPYTVSYPVIPGTQWFEVDERVVERSGKMKVLDAMLKRLKSNGHKVLIFSVFTKTLDVIEAYLEMRGYIYTRLDGTRNIANRQENIKKFNSDDDVFVFLISTRAGGLGINLVAADTVILYDSDWNPQVDLQAQDRCHRIGQTKPVAIYRFISKGTFDERLIEVAERKKQLDKIVVQHGKFHNWKKHEIISVYELKELLQQAKILNKIDPSTGLGYTDEELDALCDRAAVFGTATNEEYVKYESQDALAAGFNTAIKKEYVIDESQDTLAAGYNTAIKEEYVIDESEDALSVIS